MYIYTNVSFTDYTGVNNKFVSFMYNKKRKTVKSFDVYLQFTQALK